MTDKTTKNGTCGEDALEARALNARRSDSELMISLARGDMDPLGELYTRYGGMVRTLLWRLIPNEPAAEAEDLCHEVFMTVYETAQRFEHHRDLRPWLFGIAVHKARGWRRKKWVRENLLRRYTEEDDQSINPIIESVDSSTATRHQIERVMSELPHSHREVLVLFFTENMNGQQIADALGIPLNTVWTRLRMASSVAL